MAGFFTRLFALFYFLKKTPTKRRCLYVKTDTTTTTTVVTLPSLHGGIVEPSHSSRGAPEVPEPLTVGAQYLTRYNTWKKFVRVTRPALVCACPKTNIQVKFPS